MIAFADPYCDLRMYFPAGNFLSTLTISENLPSGVTEIALIKTSLLLSVKMVTCKTLFFTYLFTLPESVIVSPVAYTVLSIVVLTVNLLEEDTAGGPP